MSVYIDAKCVEYVVNCFVSFFLILQTAAMLYMKFVWMLFLFSVNGDLKQMP